MYLSFELLVLVVLMAVVAAFTQRRLRAASLTLFAGVALGITLLNGFDSSKPATQATIDPIRFVPVQAPGGVKVAAKPEVEIVQKPLPVRRYAPIDAQTLSQAKRLMEEWSAPEDYDRNNAASILQAYERAKYASFAIRSSAQRYFPGQSSYVNMANRKRAESRRLWSMVMGSVPEKATELRP